MMRLGFLLTVLLPVLSSQPAPPQVTIIGTSTKFHISAYGLDKVELSGGGVPTTAKCGWGWYDPYWFYHPWCPRTGDPADVIRVLRGTATEPIVTETIPGRFRAVYRYKDSTDYLSIAVTFTNVGPVDMPFIGFGGLGLENLPHESERLGMPSWGPGYTSNAKLPDDTMSPSYWLRLRCTATTGTTADGSSYGVGCSVKGLGPCALNWLYTPMDRPALFLFAKRTVKRGETINFTVNFRFSRNTDTHYLLERYYADHRSEFGPVKYTPRSEPCAFFARVTGSSVGPNNPGGYYPLDPEGFAPYRLDTPEGVNRWCDDHLPQFQRLGIKRCIFWIQWWDVRTGHYPTAWWSYIPSVVKDQWPLLIRRCTQVGVECGVLARIDWKLDAQGNWRPVTWNDRLAVLGDFRRFINQGWRGGFYVDSFGSGVPGYVAGMEHLRLAEFLRNNLGDVPLWLENGTDLNIRFGSPYAQPIGDGTTAIAYGKQLEVLRRLYDAAPLANRASMAGTLAERWNRIKHLGMVPLIEDWEAAQINIVPEVK